MLLEFKNIKLESLKEIYKIGDKTLGNYVIIDVFKKDNKICVSLEKTEKD